MSKLDLSLVILLGANLLAAIYAPIADCDEVFNYWEPAHYLLHGTGMQTWELSPAYSIRSWLYVALHAAPVKLFTITFPTASKTTEFLFLRILLASVNALAQKSLVTSIRSSLGTSASWYYVLIASTSAGNFISAPGFLPNSFTMCCVTMSLASFLSFNKGMRIVGALTWLAFATVVGWPFVGLLSLPFAGAHVGHMVWFHRTIKMPELLSTIIRSFGILALEIAVDSWFAGHPHSVPFNITLYNVLPGEGQGPDIYGTEPFYFYFLNLLLNFNVAFILALLAAPLFFIVLGARLMMHAAVSVATLPFYLWLGALSLPPHKEERFMFPIYACIALNAAVSLDLLSSILFKTDLESRNLASPIRKLAAHIPLILRQLAFYGLLAAIPLLGIWRSAGLATAYNAPYSIYAQLPHPSNHDLKVCVAKEWYRFPSSFHLPSTSNHTTRLKFVRSSFRGLLPGEFAELSGLFPATSIVPEGFNDKNLEDLGKYIDIAECDFLIDSSLPSFIPSEDEPDYIKEAQTGEGDFSVVACEPFLDAASTGALGRVGWAPMGMRTWGEYCLLARKDGA